jgi:alpha-ketoglutarate-dependent taurine dioxygenase
VIDTRTLGSTVGAEITGVDVDRLLADDDVPDEIMDALETHGVLVFRGLHLGAEAQVEFCARLGEIDYSGSHHRVPGIYLVTLDTAKNPTAEYLRGTFAWHIDGCTPTHDEPPIKASILSALVVADQGGETEFASTYAAYDSLDDDEKERLEPLRVMHSLEASQRLVTPDPTPEQAAAWRARGETEQPLVWTHASGRRSLVLGASASRVVGMGLDEGRDLLDDLLARATAPALVYRHEWQVGDTVIWDNRGVLHRAEPYDQASRREMLRTTLLGDEPIR